MRAGRREYVIRDYDKIREDYFRWLKSWIDSSNNEKLLEQLHTIEFKYSLPLDSNRAADGINLRYRFACNYDYVGRAERYLDGSCTVLEMILALAIRIEEEIMDDAAYGNRTNQWFWGMIKNLGLASMSDYNYDGRYVTFIIERFLDREYDSNGAGGLFTINRNRYGRDLRRVEIWHQMCWYLDDIT